jgi:hypothetical protein
MLATLLLGYAALMTTLALLMAAQELLALAADEKAFKPFHKPSKPDPKNEAGMFIAELEKARNAHAGGSIPATPPNDLTWRTKLMRPFPLRSYMNDPARRAEVEEVLSYFFAKLLKTTSGSQPQTEPPKNQT